ncbi:transposase [Mesorhizobium sp. M0678]|uniref:transposase n=1 Tax=Mesorhizobium sp. M0678 TaxID=2956985 RepID=UPI0033364930
MEIVSGTGQRRSWSTALKEQLVSETLEPGVTVTQVARRHDLDRSLICRWRRAFGLTRLRQAPFCRYLEPPSVLLPRPQG